MTDDEIKAAIRDIKRRFFAMRNGALGAQLRERGIGYKVIFGLNLPQIAEIAAKAPRDAALAESLWRNTTTRESMLIAPMLMPPEAMTKERAREWVDGVPTIEVADILCHRLLRNLPAAAELAFDLLREDVDAELTRYTGLRIMSNLLLLHPGLAQQFKDTVEKEATSSRATALVARMLLDEIEYLMEEPE